MGKQTEMEVRFPHFNPHDKIRIPIHHGQSRVYCNTQSKYCKHNAKTSKLKNTRDIKKNSSNPKEGKMRNRGMREKKKKNRKHNKTVHLSPHVSIINLNVNDLNRAIKTQR